MYYTMPIILVQARAVCHTRLALDDPLCEMRKLASGMKLVIDSTSRVCLSHENNANKDK